MFIRNQTLQQLQDIIEPTVSAPTSIGWILWVLGILLTGIAVGLTYAYKTRYCRRLKAIQFQYQQRQLSGKQAVQQIAPLITSLMPQRNSTEPNESRSSQLETLNALAEHLRFRAQEPDGAELDALISQLASLYKRKQIRDISPAKC